MRKSVVLLVLAALAVLALVATNPNEADFREHVRERQGLAGTLGMAMADLLTGGRKGAIQRDNYLVASRFYLGGDGLLPREDLGWGFAGIIFDKK